MKLAILGASGGCGTALVAQAVAAGHEVTAVVRPSSPFQASPEFLVRRGDVLDPTFLRTVLAGSDAVLCCLGLRRAGKSPWAQLLSPANLMAQVAERLTTVMPELGIGRLIAISAAGVRESLVQLTAPVRWMVRQGNVGVAYRDLAEMERKLEASSLDWLAVRPVTLINGMATGRAAPVPRYGLTSTIRRADVAAWMLTAAGQQTPHTSRTPMLGTGPRA